MARGRRAAGNPDGTPRLELFDATVSAEDRAVDDAIISAIKEATTIDEDKGGQDGPVILPQEARTEEEAGPYLLTTEEAPEAEAPVRRTYYSKKEAAAKAKETATWLLMILESAAVFSMGDEARLLANEKKAISEPMGRILARMSPELNEALEKWTDPIILTFGLLTWGMRLYRIQADKSEGDEPPPRKPPKEVPPVPPGGNGRTIEEVLTEDNAVLYAGPADTITSQVSKQSGSFGP